MSSWRNAALGAVLLAAAAGALAQSGKAPAGYPGIGRAATPAEVAAWDIDVRPDFKGLPAGAGSVEKGMEVWEGKCASCHGVFGESNQVFNPIVGGTTADDIKTGRVARLNDPAYPGRTTLMKLSQLSTLWDYINRAMPWNAPKSLTPDEVYAVTAYILNLGGIVDDKFVLSDKTMAQAQARLPNRNGMTTAHGLWPGKELGGTGQPDVKAVPCMKDCPVEAKVTSLLPDFARNAHGNLAEQNRGVGPQRGADTSRPEGSAQARAGAAAAAPAAAVAAAAPATAGKAPTALLQKNTCTACHAQGTKLVGPSWNDVAAKHAGKPDYLAEKIRSGGSGIWGSVPMPPQPIAAEEARSIASWLATGAAP